MPKDYTPALTTLRAECAHGQAGLGQLLLTNETTPSECEGRRDIHGPEGTARPKLVKLMRAYLYWFLLADSDLFRYLGSPQPRPATNVTPERGTR